MNFARIRGHYVSLFLLFVVSLYGFRALAQGTSGTISGVVTDGTGAAVSNAAVTIVNPLSGFTRSVASDASGTFHFSNLPFGRYHLSATASGFAAGVDDANVRSAGVTPVTLKLGISAASTVVNVEAEAQDMVNDDPTSATAVDRNLFSRLPSESTNSGLSSLVTLSTPGIASDSNGLYHPMGEHADTTYSIDGQPVSDQQSRVFGNQLSTNAIQSINVIDGIAPPEYGDKASLVVQTTTRSGLGLPHPTGSLSYDYGSFGTSVGAASFGFGSEKLGDFLSFDAVNSGRYLDTPEFTPLHDRGNNENFFNRADWKPTDADSIQFNLTLARSWFQQPNQFDQQASAQDQRAQIFSYNASPSWTHIFDTSSLLSVNPYLRQDNFHYYPSHDLFNDQPVTLAQSRRLQNAGVKADYAYSRGINNFKAGAVFYHTFLHEGFSLGVTDPNFNGDPGDPQFNPALAQFDLTRGGTLYHFNGRTDIKQEALYLQDNLTYKNLSLLLGGRIDNYDGISHRSLVQPRLGATYNIRQSNTVLRLGYGKLMLTPYNENLIVSSSTGVGGLEGAGFPTPLKPATRSQYDAGFEQGFGKHLIVNAEYFWKYTDRDFDFDIVLNTPLAFPIQWQKSKIDGLGIKLTMPETHGISAYSVLGHTRSRFFGPEVGGILFNDPGNNTSDAPFRIDHDQAFQQTTHMQYQPWRSGPWYGMTWRYESGLVAGSAPFSTSSDGIDPVDLTYLTADQQQQILLRCGSVQATLANPLASCAGNQLSSPLLKLPAPGTENDDRNPPRVAPRTMFDMALGWDDVLRRVRPTDRFKTNLSITAVNVTDKYALYNFLSTFSGTHFVSPRTVTGQVTVNF